jgi:hypothetical protein
MIIYVKKFQPGDKTGAPNHWRASIDGAEHCGGMGDTPAEAIGFLVLNNTGYALNEAITEVKWLSRKPRGYFDGESRTRTR